MSDKPIHPLRGLYAISPIDAELSASNVSFISDIESAIAGGAGIVQYRNKSSSAQWRLSQAESIRQVCARRNVLFIVNDDITLARAVQADGVHLGKEDGDVQYAREFLGSDAIIGVSCYNDFNLAINAQQAGASYVAFGRFFPSRTKPDAIQADIELLRRAKRDLSIPIAAIGGITPDNGKLLTAAGADMLAVIDALFGAPDVRLAAQHFKRCFGLAESD